MYNKGSGRHVLLKENSLGLAQACTHNATATSLRCLTRFKAEPLATLRSTYSQPIGDFNSKYQIGNTGHAQFNKHSYPTC